MRAIVHTISAAALAVSSLTFAGGVQADALSITYSEGYCPNPGYSIYYRHGTDYYAPYYRLPRHAHHHHDYDRHHKHGNDLRHRSDQGHGHFGPPGHRTDRGNDHRSRYSYRDGEHGGHRGAPGHQSGRHDGSHSKPAHMAYARP